MTRSLFFMSVGDPNNVSLFSGSTKGVWDALTSRYPDIEAIAEPIPRGVMFLTRVFRRNRFLPVDLSFAPFLNRIFAKRIIKRIKDKDGVLISLINSPMVAQLAPYVPTLMVSDATFACLSELYDPNSDAHALTRTWHDKCERVALAHVHHVSFSSPWAAESAARDYGTSRGKISVIPWGCNLPYVSGNCVGSEKKAGEPCRLLLVGIGWHRKGLDIALEVMEKISRKRDDFRLDIIGSNLPPDVSPVGNVYFHGFLRKDDPSQVKTLLNLLQSASFLFLPTRADCTPMVFAEGNAYGVPALSWDVGGVTGVINHGVNGLVSRKEDGVDGIIRLVEEVWEDTEKYNKLRRSSRSTYDNILNWDAWLKSISPFIDKMRAPD